MKKLQNYDILLVEPDMILAETYVNLLKRTGYQTCHVSGAQDAIMAIDKIRPRLIILELQLQSHNGIELLHELRSYPDLQGIPVVLLTFIPEPASGNRYKQFGVAEYLYKPHTSLEKLTRTVEDVITS